MFRLSDYLPIEVIRYIDLYRDKISEIRLRRGRPFSITVISENGGNTCSNNKIFPIQISDSMMDHILDRLCEHSLYSHMNQMVEGYIALKEGYRVGIAGRAVCKGNFIEHLSQIDSINIRVPHRVDHISEEIISFLKSAMYEKSLLIYSRPNMGKTTILRDIIVQLAGNEHAKKVVVIDTRREIETDWLKEVPHVDILSGYPRGKGIEIATRTLSPQFIVCDEIGGFEEAEALLSVQNCGVPVIATAHAASLRELLSRRNIRILHDGGLFSEYVEIKKLRLGKSPIFRFTSSRECNVKKTEADLAVYS